jgi:hypothetical protein
VSGGRVTLVRPGAARGVTVTWWEWRDLTSLARLYGWRGVPDAPRLSSAEASDLANALELANVSARLRETASKVTAVARAGGIDVFKGQ